MKKAVTALCAVLLVSLAPRALAQCQLAGPVLVSPTSGTPNHGQVEFDWEPVSGAASYELFLSVDNDPPFSEGMTTQTKKTVVIEPGRFIQWSVAAHAPGCTSGTSATASFTTSCPHTVPTLLSPARNARINEGASVMFSWTGVAGAASYDVYATQDFSETPTLLAENLTGRSYSTTLAKGDWNWWVRANYDGACAPGYSEPSSFFIGAACNNPAPVLSSPADGATVSLPVTFDWNAVAGANEYDVFLLVDRDLRFIGRTTQTSLELTHGVEGTIEWFVRASFPGDCPDTTSSTRTITIKAGENTCPTGEAIPRSPADGATNLTSPVKFSWTGVPGATGYRLLAAIGAPTLIAFDVTTETSLETAVPAGSGYWVVQTFFGDDCPSTISDKSALTVTTGAPCDVTGPDLLEPANHATNVDSPVTFKWKTARGAYKYTLFVSTDGGAEFSPYGTTTEPEIERLVPRGEVRWYIVASFAGCPDQRSSIFSFTSGTGDDCPTGTIDLLSPAQDASVSAPVTLSWSPLPGVDSYRVTVIVDGETSIGRQTTNTQQTFDLPAGAMRWYVAGISQDCDPVLSTEGRFTVQRGANCASNPAPVILGPIGTEANPIGTPSPVTLRWTAATGALGYRVWISRNGNAFEDIALTDQTQLSVPLPGGTYSWFAEAIFRGCDPVASSRGFFSVPETVQRCPGAAPSPISPAPGSSVPAPVEFRWTEVEAAEKYRVYVSIDGSEERLIGTVEETSLERVLPPGLARWRVEAVASECRALSSPVVEFTIPEAGNCSDEKPDLASPPNGATLADQVVDFSWTPVSGAVRYVVVVRTQDGSPVPVGDTTETTLTRRMPFGANEWWVVAFFVGCNPAESAHARFVITPDQNCSNRSPILLQPTESSARAVYSPVTFAWSRVPGAIEYQIWVPQGSPAMAPAMIASTTDNTAEVELDPGVYRWFVVARFESCPVTESAVAEFEVQPPLPCGTPDQPTAQVVGQALSGTPYRLRWTPLANVDLYEVQESTSPTFENAQTIVAENPVQRFVHEVSGTPVQYLYRVRGISSCDDSRGPYSDPVGIFVVPPRTNNASAEVGVEGNIVQTLTLPASATPLPFVAKVDKPWLTVTPSSGVLGAEPITLTVTANPSVLYLGTNTGTVTVQYTTPSSGTVGTQGTTSVNMPVSISLVTPVTPVGKGTPPPDALIFPIVGHATGVNNSLFESDIRVANLTPQTMKYQVNFTPSNTDGTQTGSSTTIEVAPNTTTALDDIVASVFGTGTVSSALGMLEVRPLTTSATSPTIFSTVSSAFPALATAASSRTYNFTPNGTYGQFIPAVPFSKFVGKGTVLSLLQVAQSAEYRANFGFAEAAGAPVDLMMRVYDTRNTLLATIPISLGPVQHTQLNGLLSQNGINDLTDGRVEVEVVNGDGKVTAYVSELDNRTSDPLLVNAVPKGAVTANRYVVPGMAYIDNGVAFWVSDLRIFNAGAAATPATLTFYPQNNGTPVSKEITLDPGEIEVLNNVVATLFEQPKGAGGAIAITTPANTQLSATARTYNQTANGTYGQFIPGVTVAESAGAADRALQLLQLETSSRFRTNIGVTETSGNPVTVEIVAIQPDSIVTPVITRDLAAGEFWQIPLSSFFEPGAAVYNARVTVKVIAGTGRVTAYGSAIDAITQDPTYVPAQ